MGACCAGKGSVEEQAANAQINSKMKSERDNQSYVHKILLLGPGDSGKTTILKQMRKIYGDKSQVASNIIDNGLGSYVREKIMSYMKTLCQQSIKLNYNLKNDDNIEHREWFANVLSVPYTNHLNEECLLKMKSLWADNGIQTTLKNRNQYQIPDNVEYFLNDRIDDISSVDYQVTFEDFLRIRMRTTGFSSEKFLKKINNCEHTFVFTDVGGQRSERHKWINMIHNDIDAVVYVIAISEYDLTCFEDVNTMRLDEALNLFKTIISNGFCDGKTVTLFFNKYDLFCKKINNPDSKSIADIYPDEFPSDKNPREANDVIAFIYNKFSNEYIKLLGNKDKVPHYHLTTAIDTDNIDPVMKDIENDLIRDRLVKVGF